MHVQCGIYELRGTMNIVSLKTFLAIVETGSLVRASEKMNVTQSTVTARLRTLEEEVGQSLLRRNKSGATLTPAGTKLLRYAGIMVGLWRQARFEAGLPAGTDSVCNFGCHIDLWPGYGKRFGHAVTQVQPKMGVSILHGSREDLEEWLGSGVVDVILTYEPGLRGNQTIHPLPAEEIVLYTTRAGSPIRHDPHYVYVEHGDEFSDRHAAVYSDADTARVTFSCSVWGLEYLLERGGSAYFSQDLVVAHLKSGALFEVEGAPVFLRKRYLVVNDEATGNWGWIEPLIREFQS